MDPVQGTEEVLRRLEASGDTEVAGLLRRMARDVREVAPDCVGLSVAVLEGDITFTLVASAEEVAALDAVQYLDGGPCVDAALTGTGVVSHPGPVDDEARWSLFARAGAAHGIASTLSFPTSFGGRVRGSVNLYGGTPYAFDGRHERLAEVCGAVADEAVADADLSFTTRVEAARGPEHLEDLDSVNQAVGIIAESQRVTVGVADRRLREAAARGGVSPVQAAEAVIRGMAV